MAERHTMVIAKGDDTPIITPGEFDTERTNPEAALNWALKHPGTLSPLQMVEVAQIAGIRPSAV